MQTKDVIHHYYGGKCLVTKKKPPYRLIANVGEIVVVDSPLIMLVQSELLEVKLILRPLESITEEEDMQEFPLHNRGQFIDMHCHPEGFVYLLNKQFDLFDLIKSNQAIDQNQLYDNTTNRTSN
jgi:hypothetical protein